MNVFHWIKLDQMSFQNQLLWLGDWSKVIVKTGSHVCHWDQEVVQPHLPTKTDGGKGVDFQRKTHMPLPIKENIAVGQAKVRDLQRSQWSRDPCHYHYMQENMPPEKGHV